MEILQYTFNPLMEKTYVAVGEGGRCAVVDPAFLESDGFIGTLSGLGLVPEAVLLTHAHFDHIYGVRALQEHFGIPVYMHPADKPLLAMCREMVAPFALPVPDCGFTTTDIADDDVIEAAGLAFKVIHTPGHTPGGVCYHIGGAALFSGDTLFAGSIGRTDMLFGEYDDEIRSIMEKLMPLDPGLRVYPGHGPSTTIGRERTHNPFLEPFNEPEESLEDIEPVIIRGI